MSTFDRLIWRIFNLPPSYLFRHLLVECFTSLHLDNVVEAINGLRFTLPPRTKYQYCNIAIGLVGYIVTKISGMTFEDFVRTHILEPLDMRDTTWSKPSAGRNVVQGYITTWKDERLSLKTHLAATMLPHESISAATGGMLTTAADMAKWLAFLLRLTGGKSTPEDRKILTPETMKQLMRSRVLASDQIGGLCVRPGESLYEELGVPTYAQSQLLGSYRGVNIASHNGRHRIGHPGHCASKLTLGMAH